MGSIYVIEQGCYSDKKIVGVFSTKEKAEAYASVFQRGRSSDVDVTAYELDVQTTPPGLFPFEVRLVEKGGEQFPFEFGADATPMDRPPNTDRIWPTKPVHRYEYRPEAKQHVYFPTEIDLKDLSTECWARDAEHAIKIASERRAAFLHSVQLAGDRGIFPA
jgi:hypothetical protein